MTLPINLRIDGPPVAKGRPRMTRSGHAYTPAKTREAEGYLRHAIVSQAGMPRHECALSVEVRCLMAIPASWSGVKRGTAITGAIKPTGRPDLDNLAKAVLDAANGILWADDAQIVEMRLVKAYDERPGIRLIVSAA